MKGAWHYLACRRTTLTFRGRGLGTSSRAPGFGLWGGSGSWFWAQEFRVQGLRVQGFKGPGVEELVQGFRVQGFKGSRAQGFTCGGRVSVA